MIDLNPYVAPSTQKTIGSLTMSDQAAHDLGGILTKHGHPSLCTPSGFGPIVANTVSGFLSSVYFRKSAWFQKQAVHRTTTLSINEDPPVTPIFHLQKVEHGHCVVACEEAPLSEHYYEERVLEEVRVEIGIYG